MIPASIIVGGVNALALLFIGYFLRDVRERLMRLENMFMQPVKSFIEKAQ